MIKITDLQIDKNKITVEVEIKDKPYFNNVYIDSIFIDNQNTFKEVGISQNPIYTKQLTEDFKRYKFEILLGIDIIDKDNIFFIYVKSRGVPGPDTPCGEDEEITLEVLYDEYPIYLNSMKFIKELNNICIIPKNFINFVLLINGLKYSIIAKNYLTTIDIWKTLQKDISIQKVNCNCHGRNI